MKSDEKALKNQPTWIIKCEKRIGIWWWVLYLMKLYQD